jgi:predicted transcriptional regulator of viral defense system
MMSKSFNKATRIFRIHNGLLHTSEAIRLGIAPRTLYAMRDNGRLQQVSRGIYRLAELRPLAYPDLVRVALRVSKGVICLISALAFHEVTTEIPHEVYVALPQKTEKPRLEYPPLRLFWYSPSSYRAGIEEHLLDEVPVKIYNLEKTIADCFKFRHKIGMEVVLEALKESLTERHCEIEQLLNYARINRVERIMRPYLEALV